MGGIHAERFIAVDNVCAWPNLTRMPDGTIITAYYCSGIPTHRRYHMGVVRWHIDEIAPPEPTDE